MQKTDDDKKNIQAELKEAYCQLYKHLTTSYWYASTIQDKDRIRGLADSIYEILNEMDIDEIKARTHEYQEMKQNIAGLNKKLDDFKKEVDKIIHVITVSQKVCQGISRVIETAGKVLI